MSDHPLDPQRLETPAAAPRVGERPAGSTSTGTLVPPPADPEGEAAPTVASKPLHQGWDQSPTVVPQSTPEPARALAEATWQQLVGTQLGEYQLEALVGGGGMGVVFRARDLRLHRDVAVKLLSNRWAGESELKRRFQNEAQSAARLNHENIATLYDVGESNGWNYIVFEFLKGINIRDLVQRDGPLPVDMAVHITRQVTHALAHAATRDVVHRDIKPSNILLTDENRVKLVDMGLARLHDVRATQEDLTASGVTLGTFDYISPEQAQDPRQADLRSDIYSLGCTLYFMLAGRPPFPDGTVLQKLLNHSTEPPPDPSLVRADIPAGLLKVLRRMMAKSPQDRYQHPELLIADLAAIQQGLSPYSARRTKGDGTTALSWRYLPWLVTAALLMVGLVGTEMFLRTSQGDPASIPSFQTPALPDTGRENVSRSTPSDSQKLPETIDRPPVRPTEQPTELRAEQATEQRAPQATANENEAPLAAARRPAEEPFPTAEPPALAKAVRLVVTSSPRDRADVRETATMAQAIQLCAQDPALREIVVDINGVVPVNANLRCAGGDLTISAAAGAAPVLVFESSRPGISQPNVELLDGTLVFQGLGLLRATSEGMDNSGPFLVCHPGTRCTFLHCTLTQNVMNRDRYRGANVSWVQPVAPQVDAPAAAVEPASVVWQDSVVRGDGELLVLSPAARIDLRLMHTVVVSSDSMFRVVSAPSERIDRATDTGRRTARRSAATGPSPRGNQVSITLQNVFAQCDQGIGSIDIGPGVAVVPNLQTEISQSVLVLPPAGALFTHRSQGTLESLRRSLKYIGRDNRYVAEGRFWEIDARRDDVRDMFSWSRWLDHWQRTPDCGELDSQFLPQLARLPAARGEMANILTALRQWRTDADRDASGLLEGLGADLDRLPDLSVGTGRGPIVVPPADFDEPPRPKARPNL